MITALLSAVILNANKVDLKDSFIHNSTAYITSQCYTKTVHDENKNILSNPCFPCHSKNKIPNFSSSDSDLQEEYAFPSPALKNPWINLFKDRTKEVNKISDQEILKYIKEDNYKDKNHNIILAQKLKTIPKKWDVNENGKWDGYIPDCYFNFDKDGFDRNKKGKITGWRAFAYYPFLGTFWPTNGSTDDVLIRLPETFWKDKNGNFNLEVYKINLSIVESLLKQKTILTEKIDESKYGIDLNQDGKLDIAKKIVFKWTTPDYDISTNKLKNFSMTYVGLAQKELISNSIEIAPGLYPRGTEFLHSVRYLDITKNSNIKMSSRMKELRYAKKKYWTSYSQLQQINDEEIKDENDYPDRVEEYTGNIEVGLNNKRGWYYQGFVEDEKGNLRPQSQEETLFCIGCHSNTGSTADSTFVFQRKFENDPFSNGWYHWSQKDLKNIPDKKLPNGKTEYARYLKLNKAGDEFRANNEIIKKFFNKDMTLKENAIEKLKKDITYLIIPSKERALKLNKAYKVIVDEQSFIYGRDAHVKPVSNVHKEVTQDQSTKLQKVLN
ncbi:hypothetical protein [Arcobacter sp.]|uniref:hypothetical protein n=1 Tax=Arcobacter sp. TaxID=1872629 RepID=UPI003C71BDB3